MNYSDRIIRPPFEARSLFLEATSGCSHNKCKFCNYYNNTAFKISKTEGIINNLKILKSKKLSYKRVWLTSADAFSLDYDKLENIATLIHEYLPYVESIGCYSRVDSLVNKSSEHLEKLKKLGYDSIVFGVESCDDYILEYMNKGYDSSDVLKQLKKMDKADIKYTLTFLNGAGGHGYGYNHAIKTAEIFNKLNVQRIMINRLTIHEDTPLYAEVINNRYKISTSKEYVKELITFINRLEIDTFIDATNNTNIIPFFGNTKYKENITQKLEDELKNL